MTNQKDKNIYKKLLVISDGSQLNSFQNFYL